MSVCDSGEEEEEEEEEGFLDNPMRTSPPLTRSHMYCYTRTLVSHARSSQFERDVDVQLSGRSAPGGGKKTRREKRERNKNGASCAGVWLRS